MYYVVRGDIIPRNRIQEIQFIQVRKYLMKQIMIKVTKKLSAWTVDRRYVFQVLY